MAEATKEEQLAKLREGIKKKEGTSKDDISKQIATRDKLERDFIEDRLYVSFNSSPETRRTILARRPTKKEFMEIINLSIQASKYEGMGDAKSLERLGEIYGGLNKIAAKLSIDKALDEEFWEEHISFATLQNFIGEVMNEAQKTTGGITESEMKSFRGK